jgi:PAS domain S-box-containing protein
LDFVHPDDKEATASEAQKLVSGSESVFFENRYRCKDGSYKWMRWTAIPVFEQQLIYASARDITERKQAEEALRESEARYRSVIAAIEDGMVLLDSDGNIRTCNASAERILGLSADQMVGRTALDPRWRAIHEDGSPFPGETFPSMVTLNTGLSCSNVIMGVHKPSGELTWISINSGPIFEADGATVAGVRSFLFRYYGPKTNRRGAKASDRRTETRFSRYKAGFRVRRKAKLTLSPTILRRCNRPPNPIADSADLSFHAGGAARSIRSASSQHNAHLSQVLLYFGGYRFRISNGLNPNVFPHDEI